MIHAHSAPAPAAAPPPGLAWGMRVPDVHFDLHSARAGSPRYSIGLDIRIDGKIRRRVIAKVPVCALNDAVFTVSAAVRERIRRTDRRRVYATVAGTLTPAYCDQPVIRVTVNPHRTDGFVIAATGEPVTRADLVIFSGGYAWIPGELS